MLPPLCPRRCWQFVALSCAIALTAISRPLAAAEAGKDTYALPAGDAEETLRLFIRQSGVQLLYPPTEVSGVTTNAVNGEFTPRQALDNMLAGTELDAVQDTRTGAFSVRRRSHARANPAAALSGPDSRENAETVQLSPFVFTNEHEDILHIDGD